MNVYKDPRHCFHIHLSVNNHSQQQVTVSCNECGLEGKPAVLGKWKWWSESAAYSYFYTLANKVDYTVVFLFLLIQLACSAEPTFYIDDDFSETDAGTADTDADTDINTDTEQLDIDTDINTDTEQLDTDTDGMTCPWICFSDVGGDTCSPDNVEDPTGVHNRNFYCDRPGEICCQPWPQTDDLGIDDYCLDFAGFECSQACDQADLSKACFTASNYCCRKELHD